MDQSNISVDNDLQKAIDEITNTTNVDPVFTDPVAAPSTIPEGDTGEIEPIGPFPAPEPIPEPVIEAPEAPEPIDIQVPEMPTVEEVTTAESLVEPETPEPFINTPVVALSREQVKEAALRDLAPIVENLDITPKEKYDVYKNVLDNYHDESVVEPAYRAASNIENEMDRADALYRLVESIDKL